MTTRLTSFVYNRAPVASLIPFSTLKHRVWTHLQGSRPFSGGWYGLPDFAGKSKIDKIMYGIAKIPAEQDLATVLKGLQESKYNLVEISCPKRSLLGKVDWVNYCLKAIEEGKSNSKVTIHFAEGDSKADLELTDSKLVAEQICQINSSSDVKIT